MRKKSYTFSLSQRVIKMIDEVWKTEQESKLQRGESVSKSSVVEKLLLLGIKKYKEEPKNKTSIITPKSMH
mgnify:CR=1 FL=1